MINCCVFLCYLSAVVISKFPQLVHPVPRDRTEHRGDELSGEELTTDRTEH